MAVRAAARTSSPSQNPVVPAVDNCAIAAALAVSHSARATSCSVRQATSTRRCRSVERLLHVASAISSSLAPLGLLKPGRPWNGAMRLNPDGRSLAGAVPYDAISGGIDRSGQILFGCANGLFELQTLRDSGSNGRRQRAPVPCRLRVSMRRAV